MPRYALLCGFAPDGFSQSKINQMHDFLVSAEGGSWAEREIMILPNGADGKLLSYVLGRLKADGVEEIMLYVCFAKDGAHGEGDGIDFISLERLLDGQKVIYDVCDSFVPEDYSEESDCAVC